ncbi:MAG TPA: histidine ammonia-lyase [Candidatus Deferrimicrobium sp.]|nr:histidine ammonia-lyase [Candidatus Deferrimicrobium sp.]
MFEKNKSFHYGEDRLSAGLALEIARGLHKGIIDNKAAKRIDASRDAVKHIVERGETVYGINTGFGPLCTTLISPGDTKKLQCNLLKSHSAGVGERIPNEIAQLMMVLKVHALAQGYSGISRDTLERIIWHIENEVTPIVPSQGSVGASGDLAPLAHLFLPLIGLGQVFYRGKIVETNVALQDYGLKPLELGPKEGLALINGTQFIAAFAVKGLERLLNCLDTADIIGAMTLEGLLGSVKPFKMELHNLRPFIGCQHVAHRLQHLLMGSKMVESHAACPRVQDPYSLRCMPQVHGASRNAWLHLKEILEVELNSVTDNPIILDKDHSISGGNFHGQPMALPLDYAAIAASELGNISDRRTYLLLEGGYEGLPKLLVKNTGINSGFMITQYTSAALVSENKGLCFPASADSIPTSLGQEDHVSMGSISARKLNRIIDNLENILAVELVCAAQAFDFRRPLQSGKILEACHARIRQDIDHADEDRVFACDLDAARQLIQSKDLIQTSLEVAQKENIALNGEREKLFEI